jgi:tetratricopeptide (TPR) repeat protein
MELGWLQQGVARGIGSVLSWLGEPGSRDPVLAAATVLIVIAVALRAMRWRGQRRVPAEHAVQAGREADALKQELRLRLSEPGALAASGARAAPAMGAGEAFEGDIDAVAKGALREAGGHRARARELLRGRMNGGGASLDGSEAACWRQLGALSLLDDLPDAAYAYAQAAELAPGDAEAQMLAGVLHLRAGDLARAEKAFRRQVEVSNADGQGFMRYRGHTLLGDVLALRGETDAAMAAYGEAESGVKALVEREPDNARYQRDLSITCDRIGDMLAEKRELDAALASYRRSLEIAEALGAREPDNPVWQHDLSVSHDRIGDLLDRQGNREAALASFSQGLRIARSLAEREPGCMLRQWDLSASYDRIGDVQIAQGRMQEALSSYRRSTEIAEALVRRDPAHAGWQRDLAVSYHKLGSLQALDDPAEAREALEKGRAIIARLAAIADRQAQWRSDLSKFDDVLRTLDR